MKTDFERWDENRRISAYLEGQHDALPVVSREQLAPMGKYDEVRAIQSWLARQDASTYSYECADTEGISEQVAETDSATGRRSSRRQRRGRNTQKNTDQDHMDIGDDGEVDDLGESLDQEEELFVTWAMLSKKRDRAVALPMLRARRTMRRSALLLDALSESIEEGAELDDATIRLSASGTITIKDLDDLKAIFVGAGMKRQFDALLHEYVGRLDNAFSGFSAEDIEKLSRKKLARVITMAIPDPSSRFKERTLRFRLNAHPADVASYFNGLNIEDDQVESDEVEVSLDVDSLEPSVMASTDETPSTDIDWNEIDKLLWPDGIASDNQDIATLVATTPVFDPDDFDTYPPTLEVPIIEGGEFDWLTDNVMPPLEQDSSLVSPQEDAVASDIEIEDGPEVPKTPLRHPYSRLPGEKYGIAAWYRLPRAHQLEVEFIEKHEEHLMGRVFGPEYEKLSERQKFELVARIHVEVNSWEFVSESQRYAVHGIVDRLYDARQ